MDWIDTLSPSQEKNKPKHPILIEHKTKKKNTATIKKNPTPFAKCSEHLERMALPKGITAEQQRESLRQAHVTSLKR